MENNNQPKTKNIPKLVILLTAVVVLLLVVGFDLFINRPDEKKDLRSKAADNTLADIQKTYGFESASALTDDWTIDGTGASVVGIEGNIKPHGGSKMLKLDNRNSSDQYKTLQLLNKDVLNNVSDYSLTGWFFDPGSRNLAGNLCMQFRMQTTKNSAVENEYITGLKTTSFNNTYYIRPGKLDKPFINTGVKRPTEGEWRQFEIRVTPSGAYGLIQEKGNSTQMVNLSYIPSVNDVGPVNNNLNTITNYGLAVGWGCGNVYFFDDLKFTAYSHKEIANQTSLKMALRDYIKQYVDYVDSRGLIYPYNTTKAVDPKSKKELFFLDTKQASQQSERAMGNYILAKGFLCRFVDKTSTCYDSLNRYIHSIFKNENYALYKSSHPYNTGYTYGSQFKGAPSASFVGYAIGLAAWLNWDKIMTSPDNIRQLVYDRISDTANYLTPENTKVTATAGNGTSEEYAWHGAFMSLAGNMFNNDSWRNTGKQYLNLTLNKENFGQPNPPPPGMGHYAFWNHNMFHPAYTIYTLSSVSEGLLTFKIAGRNYSDVINTSSLRGFADDNLNDTINYNTGGTKADFRFKKMSAANGNLPIFRGINYGGKDDWLRSVDTIGQSAFSMLETLDYSMLGTLNDNVYKDRLYALMQYRIDTDQANFLPYYIADADLVTPPPPPPPLPAAYDVTATNAFRTVIESTEALYDTVAYLWHDNLVLRSISPVTPAFTYY